MTNSEAIEILKMLCFVPTRCNGKSQMMLEIMEAIDIAIKALEGNREVEKDV
jgi:hypothetical protein